MNDDRGVDAILRRRAEKLAQVPPSEEGGDEIEVLACRLGEERYAVETRHLRAVQWVSEITPVPGTPPYVLGIVSVRGEIVTLLELAAMIGLRRAAAFEAGQSRPALLLGLDDMRAGLVVDEVLGVERLEVAALQPSLSGREFARGIAPDSTVLLDLVALFAGGRFTISDEA